MEVAALWRVRSSTSCGPRRMRCGPGYAPSSTAWSPAWSGRTRRGSGRPGRSSATSSASPAGLPGPCCSPSPRPIRRSSRSRRARLRLTPERQMMTLRQFENALDRHRREAFAYLETLSDEDLQRKARIPLFEQLLGTDEVTMVAWVRVLFAVHWGDHADQLAKIRKAVGLRRTECLSPSGDGSGIDAHAGGPFRRQRAETSALARMTRPGIEQARTRLRSGCLARSSRHHRRVAQGARSSHVRRMRRGGARAAGRCHHDDHPWASRPADLVPRDVLRLSSSRSGREAAGPRAVLSPAPVTSGAGPAGARRCPRAWPG